MSNWIEKTIRSFSIGGASALRFMGDSAKNPEAQHFHKMVRDLPSNSMPTACIDYFMEHFGHYREDEIQNLHLDHEVTFVIQQLIPFLQKKIQGKQQADKEFAFLLKTISVYVPDLKSNHILGNFIFVIIETDDESLLNLSSNIISRVLLKYTIFQAYFFKDEGARLWNSCFIQNPNSNKIAGPVFINAIQIFNVRNIEKVKSLMTAILESFQFMKLCEATSQNAIEFISFFIIKFNTGNFLSVFFDCSLQFFSLLDNFDCFSRFLVAQTADPAIPWKSLNEICSMPELKRDLMISTIDIVFNLLRSPQITIFKAKPFSHRIREIPLDRQKMLFEIVNALPFSEKLNFFVDIVPTWKSGADTSLVEMLVKKNEWGSSISTMISAFVLVDDFDTFKKNINEDKSFSNTLSYLFSKVTSNMELSIALYHPMILLSLDDIEVANEAIKKLVLYEDPTMSSFPFIASLQNDEITDKVFDIFSSLATRSPIFVATFLQNNGVSALFHCLKSEASIDFLASIAGNGPYELLDSYISEHFEESKLAELSQESLCKLMMGLKHDSDSTGLLRIPSLCKFVKNIPILTQFDRYIFGNYSVKYMNENDSNSDHYLRKYAPTYMEPNVAMKLCNDPEMLTYLTNPSVQHFPVFQCHLDSPHCAASIKLATSTTFWIYVEKILKETTILSTHFGEIKLKADTIQFFGMKPIICLPQRWHMITILLSDKTFTQQNVTCYFDLNQVGVTNTGNGTRAILGSETKTNAIYYFSGSFQTSTTISTMSEIKQRYKSGPGFFCPTSIRMKPGFTFIPYKGIAKYLPRLGGPEFIFLKMLEATEMSEFNLLVESAFNLLHLLLIDSGFFFAALRYTLFKKKSLFNNQLEPLLFKGLQMRLESRWEYSNKFILDYNILSMEGLTFVFLPQIIEVANDPSQLFNYLIDSFIIFDLKKETEQNFINCISTILNMYPKFLKKILLTITSANFIDSPFFLDELYDPRMKRKQDILYQMIIDNTDLLPKFVPFDVAIELLSTMRDDLALDMIQNMAKMTLVDPNYFSIDVLKKCKPLFTVLIKEESLWRVLFTFYTGSIADKIDDFAELDMIRPLMTEDLLDLVCERMAYENTSIDIEMLSIRILRTLIKLIAKSNVLILDFFNQIQRLCALGFDQYANSPMPFSLEEDTLKPKLLSMIQSSFITKEKVEKFTFQRVYPLDPVLFEETKRYLSKSPDIPSFNIDAATQQPPQQPSNQTSSQLLLSQLLSSPKAQPTPEIFKRALESENADVIAKLASNTLVEKLNNSLSNARKMCVRMLINSADVLPEISIPMHRKIALYVLSSTIPLNDEAYEFFIKFEITRIIEGWWDGQINTFFKSSFPRYCKSTKHLLVSCLSRCENEDEKLNLMVYLCNSPFFAELANDPLIITVLAITLSSESIMAKENYQYIKNILMKTIPDSPFTQALSKGNLTNFVQTTIDPNSNPYTTFMNENKKQALSASKTDRETRFDVTKNQNCTSANLCRVTRLMDSFFIRTAFRYQFFNRFNTSNLEVDAAISKIFHKKSILNINEHPNEHKYMLSTAPQPFVVPQKLIPLTYYYPIPEKKTSKPLIIPQSKHFRQYPSILPEISVEQYGPKCLDGWDLPPFVNSASLAYLLKIFFDTKTLIGCSMLSTPEVLPCVGSISNDYFSILMNADLVGSADAEEIALKTTSDMLCHFAAFEDALYGVYGSCRLFANHPTLRISFNDIILALPRRFIYTNTEVDFFLTNGLHFTFVMKESDRKLFMSKIKPLPDVPYINSGPLFAANLLAAGVQNVSKMWVNQELSTYDYLMYLNIVGGRSFNDLSQYPVFPWVLGDYNKNEPVLKRDLTKPMGIQTKARMERFKINYEETEPHCHYGTHYSNPAAVMHYMMRVEPFTFFNLHLHNGMDHVDRQFTSINDSWHSASESNQSDLKELIPEFYTLPIMFEDVNKIDFKFRTDGTPLNYVLMPPWGKDSFTFIWKMREALECPETTSSIGSWIDLIFGFKQRGQAAIDAMNVFQPLTYDLTYDPTGSVNENWHDSLTFNISLALHLISDTIVDNAGNSSTGINSSSSSAGSLNDSNVLTKTFMSSTQMKGIIDAVNQFGQCPAQLFTYPHPRCNRTEIPNIINSKFRITQLTRVDSEIDTIQFKDDLPFFLPRFEHRIGPKMSLVKVWDSYIEQVYEKMSFMNRNNGTSSTTNANNNVSTSNTIEGDNDLSMIKNKNLVISSVDSVTATCVSSDSLYLAVASRLGVIDVFHCISDTPILINQLITTSFCIRAIGISSQHGMVCAADQHKLMLFDYSTSFLMCEKELVCTSQPTTSPNSMNNSISIPNLENFNNNSVIMNEIEQIVFDDVSNLIVCMSQNGFTVYGLDLRFIAQTPKFPRPFTCISVCDSSVWQKKPFFATGHVGGYVYCWTLDIDPQSSPIEMMTDKEKEKEEIEKEQELEQYKEKEREMRKEKEEKKERDEEEKIKESEEKELQKEIKSESGSSSGEGVADKQIETDSSETESDISSSQERLDNFNIKVMTAKSDKDRKEIEKKILTKLRNLNEFPASSCDSGERSIKPTLVMQTGKTLITAVSIFARNRAIIAVDRTGGVSMASTSMMRSRFISQTVFRKCSICGNELAARHSYRCTTCGLFVCKSCIVSKKPLLCSSCREELFEKSSTSSSIPTIPSTSSITSVDSTLSSDNNKNEEEDINEAILRQNKLIRQQKQAQEEERQQKLVNKGNQEKTKIENQIESQVEKINNNTNINSNKKDNDNENKAKGGNDNNNDNNNNTIDLKPEKRKLLFPPSMMRHSIQLNSKQILNAKKLLRIDQINITDNNNNNDDAKTHNTVSPLLENDNEEEEESSDGFGVDLTYRNQNIDSVFKFSSDNAPKQYRHSI